MTSGDHPNNYIIVINQNTEKRPGRLVVTQNTVKDEHVVQWILPFIWTRA